MLQDLRDAWRGLTKQPAFSAIAIFVLAIGIGATTAIFTVVDAVLLRPLAYHDPDRLVAISTFWRRSGVRGTVSAPDFHDYHDQSVSFDGMAAYAYFDTSVRAGREADYIWLAIVTPEFFPILGARAELGRLPTAAEQQPGGPLVAVVSHAFFTSKLGGDPSALGRTITRGDRAFTIVGVLPREAQYPPATDVWVPWSVEHETTSRSAHNYRVIARLKPGTTLGQARADVEAVASRLEREYPQSNDGKGVAVDRLLDRMVINLRSTLDVIFGVVFVVLLIACANVSNLLLARAGARAREVGIRSALGASRWRVVRQLLVESAVLAVVAGGLGVLVAAWSTRTLVAIAPAGLPRLDEVAVDMRVLLFALTISLFTTFVFGIAPALHASRVDLNELLRQGGRGSAGSLRSSRLRAALVVFETAAAVVLVIGAGLLIRSFAALSRVDLGFPTERLLLIDTAVPANSLEDSRRAVRFYERALPDLAVIPGVRSIAAVMGVPTDPRSNGGYVIEGGPTFEQLGVRSPQALFLVSTPGYFATIGVPLARGRDFSSRDVESAPLVTIVNEALVRASFPDRDPIGQRIMTGLDGSGFMTIVGVVADLRAGDPGRAPQPQIYMPYQQHPRYGSALTFVLRTTTDPAQVMPVAGRRIRALNPDVPAKMTTMEATIGEAISAPRFRTVLLGAFAGLALLLAAAGVYGVVSFTVSQRMSEMGVRMALGARPLDVVGLTLASGLRMTALGVAVGWVASLALSRILSSMLFATTTHDPVIFGGVPLVLIGAACLASLAPALRAAHVDPVAALRAE